MSEAKRHVDNVKAMQQFTEEVADQSVYVYRGQFLVDHFPPNTRWDQTPVAEGMALKVWCFSPSRHHYVLAKEYRPGDWTFCGRGHPDAA